MTAAATSPESTSPESTPAPRVPCRSCPWRVDQSAADIPQFSLEKAERLDGTCGQPGTEVGLGAPWFGCHQSRDGAEIPCAGWLAVVGVEHLGVRLAVVTGDVPAAALRPGAKWPALHGSFAEVIAKLRSTTPPLGVPSA